MADIPKEVLELVARFEQNLDAYQSQGYNETQVRLEFINPLFEALGWDVGNKIVRAVTGTGKSTTADTLAQRLGADTATSLNPGT